MCIRDSLYLVADIEAILEDIADAVEQIAHVIAGSKTEGIGPVSYTHLTLPTSDLV